MFMWRFRPRNCAGLPQESAKRLGLSPEAVAADAARAAEAFAGRLLPPGARPFAHAYGGHQFGSWAGQGPTS